MSEIELGRTASACPPRVEGAKPRIGRLRPMLAAVQFLTRLPIPAAASTEDRESLRRCPIYFPLVATAIGLFTAGLIVAGSVFWPLWLAVLVALAAELVLTGALHEDAVADFCDAFGGGWTREDVLRILQDSRLGSYGVLGLAMAVALRGGAIMAIIEHQGRGSWWVWGAAIVAAAVIGRWTMLVAMVFVPPIPRRDSLARQIGGRLSYWELAAGTCWLFPAAFAFAFLMPAQFAIAVGMLALATWSFLRWVQRKLGGLTGDCLGCLGYLAQVIVLLAAAVRIGI